MYCNIISAKEVYGGGRGLEHIYPFNIRTRCGSVTYSDTKNYLANRQRYGMFSFRAKILITTQERQNILSP